MFVPGSILCVAPLQECPARADDAVQHPLQAKRTPSWWFQPIWKIEGQNGFIFPQVGVKMKQILETTKVAVLAVHLIAFSQRSTPCVHAWSPQNEVAAWPHPLGVEWWSWRCWQFQYFPIDHDLSCILPVAKSKWKATFIGEQHAVLPTSFRPEWRILLVDSCLMTLAFKRNYGTCFFTLSAKSKCIQMHSFISLTVWLLLEIQSYEISHTILSFAWARSCCSNFKHGSKLKSLIPIFPPSWLWP